MADLPSGTVTLLFTDMEGSTRLQQQLGERYAGVLAKCRQVLRSAIGQWHGQEVHTQSDAFFVVFARASDAASAAVAIQRALASHAWPQDAAVRVRIGMHTGEPQLFAEGYVGMDVNYAARIMSAGHGGQILLSRTTGALVESTLPKASICRTWANIASRTCDGPVASFNSASPTSPEISRPSRPSTPIQITCPCSPRPSLDASRR